MAPDTTRKAEAMTDQPQLEPITLAYAVKRYEEILSNILNDPTVKVSPFLSAQTTDIYRRLKANPPADERAVVTSLQRELAEARAETESLKSRASLTPLTDPSVRGVLVDDGKATDVLREGVPYVLRDSLVMHDIPLVSAAKWQPVKLRPASEFGVPDLDLTNYLLAKLSDALGIKFDRRVGAWLDPILEAIAKLKSTPAEPAQKLVPLPEGRFAQLRESDGLWIEFNPALYGVPAERVRELEAQLADFNADHAAELCINCSDPLEYQQRADEKLTERVGELEAELATANSQFTQAAGLLDDRWVEAERLRKAIEKHKATINGASDTIETSEGDEVLWSALAPSTAASGENMPAEPVEEWGDIDLANTKMRTTSFEPAADGGLKRAVRSETLTEFAERVVPPSAPAAESEGGELSQAAQMYFDLVPKYDALSARLAACEERCKELEAGIAKHQRQHQAIYEELDGAEKFDCELWSLLAPKAEGGGDGD